MSHVLRSLFVVLVLLFSLPNTMGCGKQRPVTYASPEGIERPARPLEEEKDASDRAGEVIVVIIVVGSALAVIAIPILLFTLL